MNKLILATKKGIVICEHDGNDWHESTRRLTDQHNTSVIAREGVILAGTENGVFRSDDEGKTWEEASNGLMTRHVRWMAFHPDISDF
jgi:hypothetical protein